MSLLVPPGDTRRADRRFGRLTAGAALLTLPVVGAIALARVTGETAPPLLTAFGSNDVHYNPVRGAQSALPLFVYSQAGSPFKVDVNRAWAAALTLIVIVILLTVLARLITRRNRLSVT